MNRVRFIMRSGHSFTVVCEEAKVGLIDGDLTSYTLKGIRESRPLYICIEDIAAVIDDGPVSEEEKA